jgi:hypothetical protein
VAEPTGGGTGEGIRTEKGVMSLLVPGYVKDEIMGMTLDVVRPSSTDEEDDAELVLGKGSPQEELLSLMEGPRRVSRVREVSTALANSSAESKPKQ